MDGNKAAKEEAMGCVCVCVWVCVCVFLPVPCGVSTILKAEAPGLYNKVT